jgi:hypothetical protein
MEKIKCLIWGMERSPRGTYHWCHADYVGLDEAWVSPGEIKTILAATPSFGGVWVLRQCIPLHDGTLCRGCQYNGYLSRDYKAWQ